MTKTLSIIIPTYNMEAYIERCVASMTSAERPERLEILIINDGSKDKSSDIAHRLESENPGVVKVVDKENGNYGSCVNRGLKEATGKFVKVIDADDWLNTAEFNRLIDVAEKEDVDCIISGFVRNFENPRLIKRFGPTEDAPVKDLPLNQVVDFDDICTSKYFEDIFHYCYTFRRELLIEHGYTQMEGIFYTDLQWTFKPMFWIRKVYCLDALVYHYLIGREGQSTAEGIFKRRINDFLASHAELLRTYKVESPAASAKVIEAQDRRLWRMLLYIYKFLIFKMTGWHEPKLKEFDECLKDCNPAMYDRLATLPMSHTMLPIKFVKVWRENPDSLYLKLSGKAYRLVHGEEY